MRIFDTVLKLINEKQRCFVSTGCRVSSSELSIPDACAVGNRRQSFLSLRKVQEVLGKFYCDKEFLKGSI